jgi:imidazole glycerol-phosphate synthase subunit HisF
MPCLLLRDESLVKSIRFKQYNYIGDPINTVRIFNELEVDELVFLDIRATVDQREPNLAVLGNIADECFMPLAYGGGIRDRLTAQKILTIGFEKIVVNSYAHEKPEFVTELAEQFGSQSVIGSIDVIKTLLGKYVVCVRDGTQRTTRDPVEWAQELQQRGAGELLLTSIDRDGTWSGYDVALIRKVASAVTIPVIASGGAGRVEHMAEAVKSGGCSAVAVGSMVVFQGKGMGVLVSFPDKAELARQLA